LVVGDEFLQILDFFGVGFDHTLYTTAIQVAAPTLYLSLVTHIHDSDRYILPVWDRRSGCVQSFVGGIQSGFHKAVGRLQGAMYLPRLAGNTSSLARVIRDDRGRAPGLPSDTSSQPSRRTWRPKSTDALQAHGTSAQNEAIREQHPNYQSAPLQSQPSQLLL
jgi:hypothetical protein